MENRCSSEQGYGTTSPVMRPFGGQSRKNPGFAFSSGKSRTERGNTVSLWLYRRLERGEMERALRRWP